MSRSRIEEIIRSADDLSQDEKLELAQLLMERARRQAHPNLAVDINALAGALTLDEDPLDSQERMRSE